jgi:acetyl-CoA carboxylase carboxyl transferase subunit alpha
LFTFVDTQRLPGIGAEEDQSEAIGRNLYEMAGLRVPIVVPSSAKEGRAALAISSVTSRDVTRRGSSRRAAHRYWKSAEQAPEAARTARITAPRLKQLGLIDKVMSEPLGAHRPRGDDVALKKVLTETLRGCRTDRPLLEV